MGQPLTAVLTKVLETAWRMGQVMLNDAPSAASNTCSRVVPQAETGAAGLGVRRDPVRLGGGDGQLPQRRCGAGAAAPRGPAGAAKAITALKGAMGPAP